MSEQLLPCPFDGYKASLAQSSEKTWYVMCLKCNCEIYGRDGGDDGRIWTKEEVIDYWNTRPPQNSGADKDKTEALADEVLGHIECMYPNAWSAMSKSCRRSIRGTIINQANYLFGDATPQADKGEELEK